MPHVDLCGFPFSILHSISPCTSNLRLRSQCCSCRTFFYLFTALISAFQPSSPITGPLPYPPFGFSRWPLFLSHTSTNSHYFLSTIGPSSNSAPPRGHDDLQGHMGYGTWITVLYYCSEALVPLHWIWCLSNSSVQWVSHDPMCDETPAGCFEVGRCGSPNTERLSKSRPEFQQGVINNMLSFSKLDL